MFVRLSVKVRKETDKSGGKIVKVQRYLIGMDCGTTNLKAIILGEDGTIAAEASRRSRFISPGPNMQEQDANEWWTHTKEIFQELTGKAGMDIVRNIKGICISSHTVSMLPLDKEGRPLRNALTVLDGRSSEELEYIVDRIGHDRFVRIVGGQPAVAFLPNKLLWFKNHEPELFEKTASVLQASSYINYKLTGVQTTDIDQAIRTQCLDIKTMSWSKEIGDAIGVDLDRILPKPRLIHEIIGEVTEEAARETGLIPGIPVVAGCSDAMAAMYATGITKLEQAGESSGTTSLVFVGSRKRGKPDAAVTTKPCAVEGMRWLYDAPIQSSGATLKWFIETLAGEERVQAEARGKNIYTYLNELALEAEPGSRGLLFFPYILGERAPLWEDYARGMFIGMGMDLKRCELVRSVFEGTAYALRHVVETIRKSGADAKELRICGGGAKSRTWSMIKASVLHMPVLVLDEKSGDVPVGDALIVGHKVGVFTDPAETVDRIIKVKEVIEPIPEWEKAYDQYYPYYIRMYQHLDQDLKQLKATRDSLLQMQ